MAKVAWTEEQGIGADFKVGDRIRKRDWKGTIIAIEKNFQESLEASLPYFTQIKFDNYPHISWVLTRGLKKL